MKYKLFYLAFGLHLAGLTIYGQEEDLIKMIENDSLSKHFVTSAFKSTRVINGHSMEFLGAGVLDVRILHRFGVVNSGFRNLFGLDQAAMRLGFDYGITRNLMIGIGRSTLEKELDGFIKFRPVQQSTGPGSFPVSIVLISGVTLYTYPWPYPERKNFFSSRLGFYNEVVIGRKFSDKFSLQLSPGFIHRNLVSSANDENDTYVLGLGGRYKLTKRLAFVVDYHYILHGKQEGTGNPLSIGFDIETGGHVFQLHFSNSQGMNEKAFVTGTTEKWGDGDIRFGFNLSRVFTIRPNDKNIPQVW